MVYLIVNLTEKSWISIIGKCWISMIWLRLWWLSASLVSNNWYLYWAEKTHQLTTINYQNNSLFILLISCWLTINWLIMYSVIHKYMLNIKNMLYLNINEYPEGCDRVGCEPVWHNPNKTIIRGLAWGVLNAWPQSMC